MGALEANRIIGHTNLPLGRLPGDFLIPREEHRFLLSNRDLGFAQCGALNNDENSGRHQA
jgi:hypothetical protein